MDILVGNLGKFWKIVLKLLKLLTNICPYSVTRVGCPTQMSTERSSSVYEANTRSVSRPDPSRTSSLSDPIQTRNTTQTEIAGRERNARGAQGRCDGHLQPRMGRASPHPATSVCLPVKLGLYGRVVRDHGGSHIGEERVGRGQTLAER